MKKIFSIGFEKISVNSSVLQDPGIVTKASETFGSQSVVVSIDVKKDLFGKYYVYNHVFKKNTTLNPIEYAIKVQNLGAGEILLNSVDNDGVMKGYDLELIKKVASSLSIPIIALGGAGTSEDLEESSGSRRISCSCGQPIRVLWSESCSINKLSILRYFMNYIRYKSICDYLTYKKMEIVHFRIFIDSSMRFLSSITFIEVLVVASDTIFFASGNVSFGAKSKIGMR